MGDIEPILNTILTEINNEFGLEDLTLETHIDKTSDGTGVNYKYKLLNSSKVEVGALYIVVSKDTVVSSKQQLTRQSKEIEDKVINIISIDIEKGYRGKNYATLLLIYGLCLVLINHKDIKYAKLDDDSAKSDSLRNIYSGLLFQLDSHSKLLDSKTLDIEGPEKTAYNINSLEYLQFLLNKINDIKKKKLKKQINERETIEAATAAMRASRFNQMTNNSKKSRDAKTWKARMRGGSAKKKKQKKTRKRKSRNIRVK